MYKLLCDTFSVLPADRIWVLWGECQGQHQREADFRAARGHHLWTDGGESGQQRPDDHRSQAGASAHRAVHEVPGLCLLNPHHCWSRLYTSFFVLVGGHCYCRPAFWFLDPQPVRFVDTRRCVSLSKVRGVKSRFVDLQATAASSFHAAGSPTCLTTLIWNPDTLGF